MKRILFSIILIGLATICKAENPNDLVHNRTTYVDDYAKVFTTQELQILDQKIKNFKQKSSVEISIVTVNSLNGLDVADFTISLAKSWGVGSKSNNGLMILLAMQDHKLRTEIGYGLEGDLPDVLTHRYQEKYAVPLLKQHKPGAAINALLDAYLKELDPVSQQQKAQAQAAQKIQDQKDWDNFVSIFLNFLGSLGIIGISGFIGYRISQILKHKKELELKRLKDLKQKLTYRKNSVDELWNKLKYLMNNKQSFEPDGNFLHIYYEFQIYYQKFSPVNYSGQYELDQISQLDNLLELYSEDIDKYYQLVKSIDQIKSKVKEQFSKYNPESTKKKLISLQNVINDYLKSFPELSTKSTALDYQSLIPVLENLEDLVIKILQPKKSYQETIDLNTKISIQSSIIQNLIDQKNQEIKLVTDKLDQLEFMKHELFVNHLSDYQNFIKLSYISKESKNYAKSYLEFQQVTQDKVGKMFSIIEKIKLMKLAIESSLILLKPMQIEYDNESNRVRKIEEQTKLELKRKNEQDEEDLRRAKENQRQSSIASSSYSSGYSDYSSSSSSFGGGDFGGGGSSSSW